MGIKRQIHRLPHEIITFSAIRYQLIGKAQQEMGFPDISLVASFILACDKGIEISPLLGATRAFRSPWTFDCMLSFVNKV
jgi:hypothetical protein